MHSNAIFRTAAVDAAKVVVKDIFWFIPHYVPSIENQQLVLNQILKKDPTDMSFTERTVFRKDVNTNNNWTYVVGISGESTPTFVIVGFQARNKSDSQTHDNAVFDQNPISNAVCKIGSEKYPNDGQECDYDRDKCDQACNEIGNIHQLKSETNLLNPISDLHKFRRRYAHWHVYWYAHWHVFWYAHGHVYWHTYGKLKAHRESVPKKFPQQGSSFLRTVPLVIILP